MSKLKTGTIRTFTQEISNSAGTATSCSVQFSKLVRRVEPKVAGPWYGDVKLYVEGLSGSTWTTIYSTTHYFTGTTNKEVSTQPWYTMSFTNTTNYKKYRVRVEFTAMTYLPNSGWSEKYPGAVTMNVRLPILQDGDPFSGLAITGNDRCIDVAYMAGKFFYLAGDTVLFSQNIKDDGTGFDCCYQNADPTSEDISDVLPTDGGYIKFNTMGDGISLKTFNRGVLVFGRDVVWGLVSPLDSRFTATDYDTVELSRAGLIGPQSVVSVANFVYYWSPLGIFRVGVNQQTGSTMVAENISQQTIQSFYNNISKESKELCRGVFDYCNNRIYWYYPEDAENAPENLNRVLVYDLNYNAFMPQDVSEGGSIVAVFDTVNNYEIQPTIYVRADGDRVKVVDNGETKYVVASEKEDTVYNRHTAVIHCALLPVSETQYGITFSDFNSREFIDWDKSSFDSYMVSRPITIEGRSAYGTEFGGTYENKQVPILQTLFKRTEEYELRTPKKYIAQSGAYIRMRWGWSLNDLSNRWDLIQNAYRPQKDFMHDEYVESRIHIRGRGKSYQIEVRNDGNKDFRLAGINTLVRAF